MSEKKIKVALVQQHNTADVEDNVRRLDLAVRKAKEKGADLVVLQELHDTLYFCQQEDVDNFDLATPVPGPVSQHYSGLAKECSVVLVCSLFERRAAGLYHNTALVFDRDGSLCGRYRKMHIPDDPGYYEKFYFTPGDLGFMPVRTSLGSLGVLVCWDQWYPEAARLMALRGAEMLIYPTAIGYDANDTPAEQQRQREAWTVVQRGHAVANGLPVVAVNRVGFEPAPQNNVANPQDGSTNPQGNAANPQDGNINPQDVKADSAKAGDGIVFWGSSFACGPQGEMLCRLPENEEAVEVVEISLSRSETVRRWWPFLRDRRIDAYASLLRRYDEQ